MRLSLTGNLRAGEQKRRIVMSTTTSLHDKASLGRAGFATMKMQIGKVKKEENKQVKREKNENQHSEKLIQSMKSQRNCQPTQSK